MNTVTQSNRKLKSRTTTTVALVTEINPWLIDIEDDRWNPAAMPTNSVKNGGNWEGSRMNGHGRVSSTTSRGSGSASRRTTAATIMTRSTMTSTLSTRKPGSLLDDSNNRVECSAEEDYDRDCLNGGQCFSVVMRTANQRIQRVIGCSCPPEWKGESCEVRHYDNSIGDLTSQHKAGIAVGVVLGFAALFAAVVGGAYYCWFRKKKNAALQSTLKRPLKANSSVASGGVGTVPDVVDGGTKLTYSSLYGRNSGSIGPWTTQTSMTSHSARRGTDTFNRNPLTPTRSFPMSASYNRNSTSSSPGVLPPMRTYSPYLHCSTCTDALPGVPHRKMTTPTPRGRLGSCHDDVIINCNPTSRRQVSSYDNGATNSVAMETEIRGNAKPSVFLFQ